MPALNDVAEVVASRLAKALGIPAAECRYATRGPVMGVISRNVMPAGSELQNATVYLAAVPGFVHRTPEVGEEGEARGFSKLDEGYTLDAVEEVLDGVAPPPGCEGMSAFQAFAGFLVLDVLIANNDRHPGNWAILNWPGTERLQLAPTFDHGSALGYGLTDERRSSLDIERFVNRGRARPFAGQPSLVRFAAEAVGRSRATVWLDRVGALTDSALDAALEAPPGRVSAVAATFIRALVRTTRRRLCDVDVGRH